MPKDIDPNEGLAADAVLAEDLGDEEERARLQTAEMGGTIDEDIDNWDATGLDDGSDLNFTPPAKDDEIPADDDGEVGDDKTDDKDDTGDADAEPADDAGKTDPDPADTDGDDDTTVVPDDDPPTDDEPEADGDVDDGVPEKGEKVQGIPKHRFDEVNQRRKTAEDEIARRDAEIAAATQAEEDAYDFDGREKEYMTVLLDGKTDEALAIRKEIDAAKEAKWKTETTATTRTAVDADAANTELNSLSNQAEKLYPVFDPEHADFDAGLTNRVLAYYQGYVASGQIPNKSDAFVQALADVVEVEKLDDKYGEPAPEVDPTPDPEPKPTGKDKTDKKAKAAAAKKAHQPVAGEGAPSDSTGAVVPDIETMTDDEIDALPEKTLARLRGDFV